MRGVSAAESEAPASLAIRQEIRRRVDAGETDADLVSRYGRDIVLTPPATGIGALVWALPVVAVAAAVAGLAVSFRRRRGPAAEDGDRRRPPPGGPDQALGR